MSCRAGCHCPLLIDDPEGVKTAAEQHSFRMIRVKTEEADWTGKIIAGY
jgi:hypothetical protein